MLLTWDFFSLLRSQLSQTAASMDNRVPTPASVASGDAHSQHALQEPPASEPKAEPRDLEQDPESAGGKMEAKREVWPEGAEAIFIRTQAGAV